MTSRTDHVIQKNYLFVKDGKRRSDKLKYVVFSGSQRRRTQKTIEASFLIYKDEKEEKLKSEKISFKIEHFITTVLVKNKCKQRSLVGSKDVCETSLSILILDQDGRDRVVTLETVESAEPKPEDCRECEILEEWNTKLKNNLEYRADWPVVLDETILQRLSNPHDQADEAPLTKLCLTSRALSLVRVPRLQFVVTWRLDCIRICRALDGLSLELHMEPEQNKHERYIFTIHKADEVASVINKALKEFGTDDECVLLTKMASTKDRKSMFTSQQSVKNHFITYSQMASNAYSKEPSGLQYACKPPEPCITPAIHVTTLGRSMAGKFPGGKATEKFDSSPKHEASRDRKPLPTEPQSPKEIDNKSQSSPPPPKACSRGDDHVKTYIVQLTVTHSETQQNSRENKPLPPEPPEVDYENTKDLVRPSSPGSEIKHSSTPPSKHAQPAEDDSSITHSCQDENSDCVHQNGLPSNLTSSLNKLQASEQHEIQSAQPAKPTPTPRKRCSVCNKPACDCLKVGMDEPWKIEYTLAEILKKKFPKPDTLKLSTKQRACLHAQLSLQNVSRLTVWQILGERIGLNFEDSQLIERFVIENHSFQTGEVVLYHWQFLHNRSQSPIPCDSTVLKDILDNNFPSVSEEVFDC